VFHVEHCTYTGNLQQHQGRRQVKDNLLAGWPGRWPIVSGFLLQFHEQQDENRPYPNGHRKQNQLSVSQRISSGNQIRKPQHSQSREYPEGQSALGVHGWISPRCKGRRSGTPGRGSLPINVNIMLAKPGECNSFPRQERGRYRRQNPEQEVEGRPAPRTYLRESRYKSNWPPGRV